MQAQIAFSNENRALALMRRLLRKISALLRPLSDALPDHLPLVYKLSLLITSLIVLSSGALGSILFLQQARLMSRQIDDFGNTVVTHLASAAQEPLLADDRLALGVLVSSLVNGRNIIGTQILNPDGISLIKEGSNPFADPSAKPPFTAAEITGQADNRQRWPWQIDGTDKVRISVVSFICPIRFANVTAGYALVTFSQEVLDESKEKALLAITLVSLLIIFLGIVLAFFLSRLISRPVNNFMAAIEAFDQGNYHFRFSDRRRDEIGQLMTAFDQMAAGMVQKNQVEKALDRYLSPQVARQVINHLDEIKLGGKRIVGSVLFADIIGFTKMSEKMVPEELAILLNRYFSLITAACELNRGTVDKYTGDGVMLLFGAPEEDLDHAFHAATCALLMRRLIADENRRRQAANLAPIHFRIGINAGSMLAGNLGTKEKMEYTVVGDTVNLASRICSMAEAGQIVVSRNFYDQKGLECRLVAHEYLPMVLRGIAEPVDTFLLEDLGSEFRGCLEEQLQTILDEPDEKDATRQ